MQHEPDHDAALPPRSPWAGRERIAGLTLTLFGLFALWAGHDLPFMTERGMGSGLMPRALAILIILCGLIQIALSWRDSGPSTGTWPMGRNLPVLAGVFLFAVTIRGYQLGPLTIPPLGLAVATPLAIVLSGLAAEDARLGELAIFALIMTLICIGLFRFALGLSIPVAPWLIGY
ncbi:tripartite tricarboxylate transporter TctB family protein [Paracoccus sphaerophysae]|uniref:tripartite tricarboxylate transporter TctB family protein n=1 Tax=Paracoccus sphaerophysae TaxID=690417 RepID=UPI00068E0C4E|nr:tripartite tricarboxylate transporter TctB family protein [Paracoccus sphaerophysae]